MAPDPEGDKGGRGGVGGHEGIGAADDASEKDAVEKESQEPGPPPLLYLSEVMLDRNPYQLVPTTKHKDDNNTMYIMVELCLWRVLFLLRHSKKGTRSVMYS